MSYTVKEFNRNNYGSWSVALIRLEDNLVYWVDVVVDPYYKDVDADWNQYIFFTNNEEDAHREQIQEDTDEFDLATSEAICYLEQHLEIVQDDSGKWYCNISEVNWKND